MAVSIPAQQDLTSFAKYLKVLHFYRGFQRQTGWRQTGLSFGQNELSADPEVVPAAKGIVGLAAKALPRVLNAAKMGLAGAATNQAENVAAGQPIDPGQFGKDE